MEKKSRGPAHVKKHGGKVLEKKKLSCVTDVFRACNGRWGKKNATANQFT